MIKNQLRVFTIICFITLLFLSSMGFWFWYSVVAIPLTLLPNNSEYQGVLFDNVRLISMVNGKAELEDDKAVLVMADRIVAVAKAGELTAPLGVLTVNGHGHTLMPGLIDAHIHLNDETELAAYLAYGVTGVRNMSGYPFHLKMIEQIASGKLLGPDFITTGPILNSRGPNDTVLQQTVTSYHEARAAVRHQYTLGYRVLKLYSNLNPEAYRGILAEAAELNMGITGHTPEGIRSQGIPKDKPFHLDWQTSLGKGFRTLEHIETIVWHSLRDNLNQDMMRQVASKLAESGEVVTPTLIAHKRLIRIANSKGTYLNRSGSAAINPLVRFYSHEAEQYWSQMDPSHYEQPHADFFLIATRLLHEAGVPLIAGSDSGGFGLIPGASLIDELELLVAASLSPYQALAAATHISAKAIGFDKVGQITPGFRANLLLLTGNPLQHLDTLRNPSGVMIGGQWLDQQQLLKMRSIAEENPFNSTFNRSLWRFIEMKSTSY